MSFRSPVRYSVNLAPQHRLHSQRRLARRRAWTGICAVSVLLTAGLGWLNTIAGDALSRVSAQLEDKQALQASIRAESSAAYARLLEVLEEVRVLAGLRQAPVWPERLAGITRLTPDRIVLTNLGAQTNYLQPPTPSGATPARPAPPLVQPAAPRPKSAPEPQRVERRLAIEGVAMDYADILALVDHLQRAGGWSAVELQKSAREQYREGAAIHFRMECQGDGS